MPHEYLQFPVRWVYSDNRKEVRVRTSFSMFQRHFEEIPTTQVLSFLCRTPQQFSMYWTTNQKFKLVAAVRNSAKLTKFISPRFPKTMCTLVFSLPSLYRGCVCVWLAPWDYKFEGKTHAEVIFVPPKWSDRNTRRRWTQSQGEWTPGWQSLRKSTAQASRCLPRIWTLASQTKWQADTNYCLQDKWKT